MKNLFIAVSFVIAAAPASVQASLETPQDQTLEISAQCKSAFGNLFCSGESACRQVVTAEAKAKNCTSEIKKVGVTPQPDYISDGITYRSYNCQVEEVSDCQQ